MVDRSSKSQPPCFITFAYLFKKTSFKSSLLKVSKWAKKSVSDKSGKTEADPIK